MKIAISALLILPILFNSKTSYMPTGNTATAQKDSGAYATINGIKMYYEVHGHGEPLVLIHGGGSTIPSNWSEVLPLFAKHHKVIAMELQAHGRTGDRDSPESFAQDAADVVSLLQYLKIKKADIIGFSDGACTTMEIAIHHPEVANKIVLISGNYKRDGMMPGFFEGLGKATFNDMPQPLKAAYLDVNPNQQGLLNMFHKDVARRLAFKDRSDEEMRSIKAPTLVLGGDHDVITTEHLVQLSKIIPGARLVILPGTHGSFIGESLSRDQGSEMPAIAVGIMEQFLGKSL